MSFNGKWKRTGQENAQAILVHIGMTKDMMEYLAEVETTMEFKQNGDVINETLTTGEKVVNEVYTIGKLSEFKTWDDKTVQATPVKISDTKFKVEYTYNGVHYSAVRELIDSSQLVDNIDLDHGKVVGKFMYTKC